MLSIAIYHLFSFLEEPDENACMEHMPKQGDDTWYHTCIFNLDWKNVDLWNHFYKQETNKIWF
jgi:hypothetical protein